MEKMANDHSFYLPKKITLYKKKMLNREKILVLIIYVNIMGFTFLYSSYIIFLVPVLIISVNIIL